MAYDVFISYRRDGGVAAAGRIAGYLKEQNLKVFFDFEALRAGKFNEKIYKAIDEAQDFILVLSPGALDRCVNDGDWVRREVVHAMKRGCNIVPVRLSGFDYPPLPVDMADLPDYNAPAFSHEGFDECMQTLSECLNAVRIKAEEEKGLFMRIIAGHDELLCVEYLTRYPRGSYTTQVSELLRQCKQVSAKAVKGSSLLRLKTDLACRVLKYGEAWCETEAGKFLMVDLRKGTYDLEFVSLHDGRDRVTLTYTMADNDMEDKLEVLLLPAQQARQREEAEAERREAEQRAKEEKRREREEWAEVQRRAREAREARECEEQKKREAEERRAREEQARREREAAEWKRYLLEAAELVKFRDETNGKWGFRDRKTDRIAIEAQYDVVLLDDSHVWRDGEIIVGITDFPQKYACFQIDKSGERASGNGRQFFERFSTGKEKVKDVCRTSEGYYIVCNEYLVGLDAFLVDFDGKIIDKHCGRISWGEWYCEDGITDGALNRGELQLDTNGRMVFIDRESGEILAPQASKTLATLWRRTAGWMFGSMFCVVPIYLLLTSSVGVIAQWNSTAWWGIGLYILGLLAMSFVALFVSIFAPTTTLFLGVYGACVLPWHFDSGWWWIGWGFCVVLLIYGAGSTIDWLRDIRKYYRKPKP